MGVDIIPYSPGELMDFILLYPDMDPQHVDGLLTLPIPGPFINQIFSTITGFLVVHTT